MANEQGGAFKVSGTMAGEGGDTKPQPSGAKGDESVPAELAGTKVNSGTPENAEGQVNPSAPGETGTTPGTNG